ncbi:MAG: hypothetical protein KGL53_05325, partial [Elusimicrobia bacterium]|nr:hypothetical protein [Elusimicrobiota bacterium]
MAEPGLSRIPSLLKARLRELAALGLLLVLAFGGSVSYTLRKTADQQLAESLAHDLEILTILPKLSEALRRADHHATNYILTGDRAWLEERFEDIADVSRNMRDLRRTVRLVGADGAAVRRLDASVQKALREQDDLIVRHGTRQLTHAQAVEAALERHLVDEAVRDVGQVRALNNDGIQRRLEAGERISERVLWVTLLLSAVAAALLVT